MNMTTPAGSALVELASDRHPGTQHLARFFDYGHLPVHLGRISKPFHDLAFEIVGRVPDGPELTAGLRKLVEAKDCVVRAVVLASQDEASR